MFDANQMFRCVVGENSSGGDGYFCIAYGTVVQASRSDVAVSNGGEVSSEEEKNQWQ